MSKRKVVVVLSGGLDSTVLLHYHLHHEDEVRALSINYGQRHNTELLYAQRTAEALRVPHTVVNLSDLARILPGSSQTDTSVPVPHGHYAAENMKKTVVPNRNMILLAVAIGHAVAHGCGFVSYAAHAGDHTIYPDCREEFAQGMDNVAQLCDWKPVSLLRPFVRFTKSEVVSIGNQLMVNYSNTYSCYEGNEMHCGRCGTCVERILAFQEACVVDPTNYKDTEFWKTQETPTEH